MIKFLQLFAEGEETTVGAAETAASAVDGQENEAQAVTEPDTENKSTSYEERRENFRKSIKKGGINEEFFKSEVDRFMGKRLGKMAEFEKSVKESEPILALLKKSYGAELSQAELYEAMMKDDHYFEQESIRTGDDPKEIRERYGRERAISEKDRRIAELEAQVSEQVARDQEAEKQKSFNEKMNREIPECVGKYPDFNFADWAENRVFGRMIANGFTVQQAYEMANHDGLIAAAAEKAAANGEQKVINQIRANGSRPRENGQGSQIPAESKMDPEKMTKSQRDELSRRIMRGERVTF